VESTSVTPFSPRARDRGLHAVLVALARLTIPGLANNSAACAVSDYEKELDLLVDYILGRVEAVEPDAVDATAAELEGILEQWRTRATTVADLRFYVPDADKTLLVAAAEQGDAQANTLPTLWSLRDVDQESNLFLART
jgi:hypothetical protein